MASRQASDMAFVSFLAINSGEIGGRKVKRTVPGVKVFTSLGIIRQLPSIANGTTVLPDLVAIFKLPALNSPNCPP